MLMFPGLGCISNVIQISAPFMESLYKQTKNAKYFFTVPPNPTQQKTKHSKASVVQCKCKYKQNCCT